jgi:hypothetical protein
MNKDSVSVSMSVSMSVISAKQCCLGRAVDIVTVTDIIDMNMMMVPKRYLSHPVTHAPMLLSHVSLLNTHNDARSSPCESAHAWVCVSRSARPSSLFLRLYHVL